MVHGRAHHRAPFSLPVRKVDQVHPVAAIGTNGIDGGCLGITSGHL